MPVYHSKQNKSQGVREIGGVFLLPFKPNHSSGPAPRPPPELEADIIDEVIASFKANVFFQTYEIKGCADRLLLYLTLYLSQCLNRMSRCTSKDAVLKEMYQLSIETFKLPNDAGFPLSSFYKEIGSKQESDELRAYLLQARQEMGSRLAEVVIDTNTGRPSKWWLCFSKRNFLGKSLEGPGAHNRR
eukprot:m.95967 g.95967  ORF g.95967 m.95967 type:complete len:187 (+) comp16629_c0_seq1:82-642(+)